MSQQLNLLPRAKSRHSPAAVALMILGVVLLGLFAAWGVKRNSLEAARADEAASATQLKELTAQLDQRIRSRTTELNAEIEALKPRAEGAEQVLKLAASVGKPEGYSPYFSSLGSIREDGLWLTEVAVSNAGKTLQLGGHSLDKAAVLRYTQRLNTAFAGAGVKLTSVEMTPQTFGKAGADDKRGPLTATRFSLR